MAGNYQIAAPAKRTEFPSHSGAGVLSVAGNAIASTVLLPLAASITNLRKVLLAIIILDVPLQVGTHLFWSEELAAIGALGGLEISLTTVALAILYFSWFVGYVSKRESENKISLRPALPLALYLIFEAVSLLDAADPILGSYEVLLMAQMLFLFIYLLNWIQTRRDVAFVIRMLLIGLILEAGIMIAVKLGGHDVEIPGMPGHTLQAGDAEGTERFARVGGTFASPNVAGSYLSITLTIMIGLLLLTRLRTLYKAAMIVSVSLGLIALVATYSREGWLALLCSTLLLCYIGWRSLRSSRKLILVGAFGALCLSLLSDTMLSRRLFENDEGAASSRIVLNKVAISMIEDHPILGVGANNFTLNLRNYATHEVMGEWLYAVHNKYLLVWAEAGLGGLIAYLWFVSASVRNAWRCWKHNVPLYSPLALALMCGISALMICNLFQADRGRPLMQLLIVLAAVIGTIHSWTAPGFDGRTNSSIPVEVTPRHQFA
jgi:O-antigen ligase